MFNATEYFRQIATQNKAIAHNDETNKAFFREFSSAKVLFDNSDFLAKMRDASDTVLVSQFNGEINYDQRIDSGNRTNVGAIFLLKRVSATYYNAIEDARVALIAIWEDIYAKMKHDIETNVICMRSPDVQTNPVGMIGDSYYGISVFISYDEYVNHRYDASKWN